jgi:hypothetical protein
VKIPKYPKGSPTMPQITTILSDHHKGMSCGVFNIVKISIEPCFKLEAGHWFCPCARPVTIPLVILTGKHEQAPTSKIEVNCPRRHSEGEDHEQVAR